MMNQYNRQNPFMYLLESKQDELVSRTEECLKQCIVKGIHLLFALILVIVHGVIFKNPIDIVVSLILIFLGIFVILEITHAVTSAKVDDINTMIFGDEYRDINLNNEKLLTMINHYNEEIGKVLFIKESIFFIDIIYLLIIAYYLVMVVSHLI